MPAPVFKKVEVYVCPDCGGEFKEEAGKAPVACPLHSAVTCKQCGKTLIQRGSRPKDGKIELCPECVAEKMKTAKYKELPFRPDTDEPPTGPSPAHTGSGAPVRPGTAMDNPKDRPKDHKPMPREEAKP